MTDKFVTPCALPTPHQRELLIILIEEASEVQKRATKLLRFGANEVQPGQNLSNAIRLAREIGDFKMMVYRLIDIDMFPPGEIEVGLRSKRKRLAKYMQTESDR